MTIGAGKYDDVATEARRSAKAEGVVLIVFNGEKGNGFCAQGPWPLIAALPAILRNMTIEIEKDAKAMDRQERS